MFHEFVSVSCERIKRTQACGERVVSKQFKPVNLRGQSEQSESEIEAFSVRVVFASLGEGDCSAVELL